MATVGDIFYEGYGIDDCGRTGVFRTQSKEEILRYSKRAKNSYCILELVVTKEIPIEQYTQLELLL